MTSARLAWHWLKRYAVLLAIIMILATNVYNTHTFNAQAAARVKDRNAQIANACAATEKLRLALLAILATVTPVTPEGVALLTRDRKLLEDAKCAPSVAHPVTR